MKLADITKDFYSLQKRSKIHKKENFELLVFYQLYLNYSNFNIKYPQTLTIYY